MSDILGNLADMLDGEGAPVRGDEARAAVTLLISERAEALMAEGHTRNEAVAILLAEARR